MQDLNVLSVAKCLPYLLDFFEGGNRFCPVHPSLAANSWTVKETHQRQCKDYMHWTDTPYLYPPQLIIPLLGCSSEGMIGMMQQACINLWYAWGNKNIWLYFRTMMKQVWYWVAEVSNALFHHFSLGFACVWVSIYGYSSSCCGKYHLINVPHCVAKLRHNWSYSFLLCMESLSKQCPCIFVHVGVFFCYGKSVAAVEFPTKHAVPW